MREREMTTEQLALSAKDRLQDVDTAWIAAAGMVSAEQMDSGDVLDLIMKLELAAVECRKLHGRLAKEERERGA